MNVYKEKLQQNRDSRTQTEHPTSYQRFFYDSRMRASLKVESSLYFFGQFSSTWKPSCLVIALCIAARQAESSVLLDFHGPVFTILGPKTLSESVSQGPEYRACSTVFHLFLVLDTMVDWLFFSPNSTTLQLPSSFFHYSPDQLSQSCIQNRFVIIETAWSVSRDYCFSVRCVISSGSNVVQEGIPECLSSCAHTRSDFRSEVKVHVSAHDQKAAAL